jgi:hypothetical protein
MLPQMTGHQRVLRQPDDLSPVSLSGQLVLFGTQRILIDIKGQITLEIPVAFRMRFELKICDQIVSQGSFSSVGYLFLSGRKLKRMAKSSRGNFLIL